MITTTSLKVGESLTIGLYFNDNYQLPTTCNLIVFIGGVCVGNLFTQQPEIDRVGVYYTIRLSSQDTSKMRGYRDLIVVLDDPEGFGNKKTIVGGILFDRMADEFITTSENQGYNMLIEMTVDQSIVSGNVELIEAIKGERGDPFEYSDFTEAQLESLKVKGDKGDKGDKGEDAVLPDGIVVDLDYVHTDNNYTDNEKSVVSNTSGINTGDQDLSNLLSLQHLSDFNHTDIVHQNRIALDSVSGINTGDQDLSGLATKSEMTSGLSLKVDKEAGKQLSTEDYTSQEKVKLANISENANNYILPSDVVQDANYVHTDNNFTDSLLITLSNQSGVNTGDQDLSGLVEKRANHSLVSDTEIDKLSEYPELLEETTNKVISDTGELVSIPTPSGGYANNLYLGETDSDVAGYKILTYIADTAETIKTVTANSSTGVLTAQTFIYPTGVSVSNFPSGLWSLKLWGNISASAGVSQVGFTYFKRSVAGVETDLFTLWSGEVNNTSNTWIDVIGTQPSYSVDPTDRMGLRLLFKTTSGTNKTLTYSIGDGYAAFVNNPNQIRHSQTRDKNGEAAFQHVDTTTTKTTLDAEDMVAIEDSVTGKMVLTPKSNFDADNLIAEYTYTGNKEVIIESIDYATYIFTSTAHGLANGDVIVPALNLNNTLFARDVMPINVLQVTTTFKVAEATANTFKITKADVVVQPVSHATVDFTKWHFERTPTTFTSISITNLPTTLKRCRVEVTQYSANICYYRCTPSALTYLTAKGFTNQADVASCLNAAYYEVLIDIIAKKLIYRGNFYRQRLASSSYDSQVLNFAGYVPSSSLTHIPDITLQFGFTAGAINGTSIKIYKL